jgi:hypothetical protein
MKMSFTHEQIEQEIEARMKQKQIQHPQAIGELLAGAHTRNGEAEKKVMLAQDALTRAKTDEEISRLNGIIANLGRATSMEHSRIAMLNQIVKEGKKQQ